MEKARRPEATVIVSNQALKDQLTITLNAVPQRAAQKYRGSKPLHRPPLPKK